MKEGLVALGFQVALALEGVAFAEDRHWRQSEVRFRSLIQNSSDIVMVLGPDGTINYMSPSVHRILGYAPEDPIGEKNSILLHPDGLARVQQFHAENDSRAGASPALESRLRHIDGSWRNFEGVDTNLLDDPDVGGIVVNLRDVTERPSALHRRIAPRTSCARPTSPCTAPRAGAKPATWSSTPAWKRRSTGGSSSRAT